MIVSQIVLAYRIYRGYVHYNHLLDESGTIRLEQLMLLYNQMLPAEREFYLNESAQLPDLLFPEHIEP